MKKTFRNVLAGAAILFMATGCASKCTYEEFVEKFKEAEKNAEEELGDKVDKAVTKFKGHIGDLDFDFTADPNDKNAKYSMTEGIVALAYAGYAVDAYSLAAIEDKSATYYAGSTFKIEKEDVTFEFDKYTLLTYVNDAANDTKISISYKF